MMQKVANDLLNDATATGKNLIAAADAAAARSTLQLGTAATTAATDYAAASHTHAAAQITGLATVATSGSYNDLINKPATGSSFGASYEFLEHFLSSASLAGNMTVGVTGGVNTSATITGNQFGVLQMSTGAAAATGQNARVTATANQVTFGAGEVFFSARIAMASTPWFDTTTVLGALRTGIFTSSNADGNGVYFRAKTTALEIVVRIAGVETAQTVGTLVLNQFATVSFKVNAAGTEVQAFVDGAPVATIATNLATLKAFHQIHIHRENAVATNVIAQVDFLALRYTPTTPFFTP